MKLSVEARRLLAIIAFVLSTSSFAEDPDVLIVNGQIQDGSGAPPVPGVVASFAPDWGVIISSYIASILMAGSYLGVCSLTSALTKNQVISFILSVLVCATILFLGFSIFTEFL